MILAGVFLTANDAGAKWGTQSLPVGEVIFIRGMFAVAIITLYAHMAHGLGVLRVQNYRRQTVRGLSMVVATFCFVASLHYLSLPTVTSFMFTVPIFTALFAPTLLGESVGLRRWLAIGVGLIGVLVLARPSGGGIGWVVILPIACAAISGFRDAYTRRLSDAETSLAILFFSTALETAFGAASLAIEWRMPDWEILGILALSGLLFVLAQFFTIEAFRTAEAATVAPFRYTLLISAAFWGFIIWGDLPDEWTLAGAAIIMACGLYILFYESRRVRPPR